MLQEIETTIPHQVTITTEQNQNQPQPQPQPTLQLPITPKRQLPKYNDTNGKIKKDRNHRNIVVIKRRWDSKPEIIKEGVDFHNGSKICDLIFKTYSISSASVVEVNPLGEYPEDRFNVIYKIFTSCKHLQIQDDYDFNLGHSKPLCLDCNTFIYNNPEVIDLNGIEDRLDRIKGGVFIEVNPNIRTRGNRDDD